MKSFVISDPTKEIMEVFLYIQEDSTPKLDLPQHFG